MINTPNNILYRSHLNRNDNELKEASNEKDSDESGNSSANGSGSLNND